MKTRAVVTCVGARTPVALAATPTAFLHRAAHVVMQISPLLDADGEPATMAVLPTLDPRAVGPERALALATPALTEALAPLRAVVGRGERVKMHLCLDEFVEAARTRVVGPAHDLVNGLTQQAAKLGAELDVVVSSRGPTSLGRALTAILDELESGNITVAIVGGIHTDYDPDRIVELSKAGRLFTPDALDALIPGESAAFIVLMRPQTARRLTLLPLAEVHGAACARSNARSDNDESAFEAGALTTLVRQLGQQLTDAGLRCGWMLTDLSFETMRLYELQAMSTRTQRLWCEPQYCDAPAQRLGYLGAAAAPLHFVLAAESWRGDFAPHPIAMSFTGSDDGDRAVILLSAPGPEALDEPA